MRKTTKNLIGMGTIAVAAVTAPALLASPQNQGAPDRSEPNAHSSVDQPSRMGEGMGMMHGDMPMMGMMTQMNQMMRNCNQMMEAKLQERQSAAAASPKR